MTGPVSGNNGANSAAEAARKAAEEAARKAAEEAARRAAELARQAAEALRKVAEAATHVTSQLRTQDSFTSGTSNSQSQMPALDAEPSPDISAQEATDSPLEQEAATGSPVTVPEDVSMLPPFSGDPDEVNRVPVEELEEPLRSQLLASHTIQENTQAGAGVSLVEQEGALYVAVDSQGQLVDVADGSATVFHTGTANTLSVFAEVDMQDPAAVSQAYATALSLTHQDQQLQPLPTTEPLTAEQVAAYQALGYTVAVLDPSNGNAAVRPSGVDGTDISNIGAVPGSQPVYVLMGGPPLSSLGDLTPAQLGEIYTAVQALPDPAQSGLGAFNAALDGLVSDTDALWNGEETAPGALGALTTLVADRFPPTNPLDADSALRFEAITQRIQENATSPESAAEVATALASMALRPDNAERGIHSGQLAATAMQRATTPEAAQALLDTVGPQNMEAFLGSLGLNATTEADPLFPGSGSRMLALTDFMKLAAQVQGPEGMPNAAQASFFISAFQQAGPVAWSSADFRQTLGTGLAVTYALGNTELAQAEAERLGSLLANGHMEEILLNASPEDRERLMLGLMTTPGITSELLDEHRGNLATALTYAQYTQATQLLTGDLLDGTPRTDMDGIPVLPNEPLPLTPVGIDLSEHPAIAQLSQPLTTASIHQAVRDGTLTGEDAANYLRALADATAPIANADMEAFGSSPALTNVIGFFEDFNPFNDPNPLSRSNVDDMAQAQRQALLDLANVLESSNDPALIAQGLASGIAVDATLWGAMQPYGEAVQAIGDNVQRNRVTTMIAVGTIASIAAPTMMAAGLPALGSTGTIFGMTVTGSPFLSAAMPAVTSAAMSTTMNAAMQYENTGSVQWGNAVMAGAVDGLTSFFGATVAANAMQQGWGFTRTVVSGGMIDAVGGFGAYVLGTPGALEGILSGDPEHFFAALGEAGTGFVISTAVNGATYRVNVGDPPPLAHSADYDVNGSVMDDLLDPANPAGIFGSGADSVPVYGLDGQPLDPSTLGSSSHESYFAVYRNPSTGEVQVQEVARSRPGEPLQLYAFDTVQGVRRNAPGPDWEPVGGFHNHPSSTSAASPEDVAMEPLFRGEFGEGFNSYTLGTDGARAFLNTDVTPMTLRQAYDSGYDVPGLAVRHGDDLEKVAPRLERNDRGEIVVYHPGNDAELGHFSVGSGRGEFSDDLWLSGSFQNQDFETQLKIGAETGTFVPASQAYPNVLEEFTSQGMDVRGFRATWDADNFELTENLNNFYTELDRLNTTNATRQPPLTDAQMLEQAALATNTGRVVSTQLDFDNVAGFQFYTDRGYLPSNVTVEQILQERPNVMVYFDGG